MNPPPSSADFVRHIAADIAIRSVPPRWEDLARPAQIAPHAAHPLPDMRRDDWLVWYIRAGRGWGKTLTGAHLTRLKAETCQYIAIVAPTFADGRDTCVEGESGLKRIVPGLRWNRSMGEMTFPSGARGKLYSAEEPDRLRGPNHYFAWCDEFAAWRYQQPTWDMLMFTLRKGASQVVITTTPRPSKLAREIQARPSTVVTWGATYDNLPNLSAAYITSIVEPYKGTALGRQELEAQDIDDVPGALWTRAQIEATRITALPALTRIVVAIDPAVSASDGDETGVVAAGVGADGVGYVLDDKSLRASPATWAREAVALFHKLRADRIIAEANNGGEMVAHTLRTIDPDLPITLVHANRGKRLRAEPVAALYEQGRVRHVGTFPQLEDQMCTWLPGVASPDRLDALVWALGELMLNAPGAIRAHADNPFYG
jgi:phage terminase large subunit-like protein